MPGLHPPRGSPRRRRLTLFLVALAVLLGGKTMTGLRARHVECRTFLQAHPVRDPQAFTRPTARLSSAVSLTHAPPLGLVKPLLPWPPVSASRDLVATDPPGERTIAWRQLLLPGASGRPMDWTVAETNLDLRHDALSRLSLWLREGADKLGADAQPRTTSDSMFSLARLLADATVIELHRNRLDAAARHLDDLLHLAYCEPAGPNLAAERSRCQIVILALDALWQMLQREDWNETMLAGWQADLERLPVLQPTWQALALERAVVLEQFQHWQTGPETAPWTWRWFWKDADLLLHLRPLQIAIDAAAELADGAPWTELQADVAKAHDAQRRLLSPKPSRRQALSFARLASDPLDAPAFLEGAVVTEAWRQLGTTAVALQRHRLRYGALPDRLLRLVPALLTNVPLDPFTARPLRYVLLPNHRLRLYSCGVDAQDEQGDPLPRVGAHIPPTLRECRDLVWPEVTKLTDAGPLQDEVLPLIQFEDAPVDQVILTLARQARINLIFDPRLQATSYPAVSVRLVSQTARAALESILASLNLKMDHDPATHISRITLR